MNKRIYLIFGAFLFNLNAFCVKKIEGFYINNNNDTIKTVFFIPFTLGPFYRMDLLWGPDLLKLKNGVSYQDKNNQSKFLNPKMAKAFWFLFENKQFRMLSKNYSQTYLDKLHHNEVYTQVDWGFFEAIDDSGYLTLCYMWSSKYSTHFALQKGNDKVFHYRTLNYNRLVDYFYDCPKIQQQIKNGMLESIEYAVKLYNNECSKIAQPCIKDYNLPDFYNSKSHFVKKSNKQFFFKILPPDDTRQSFIGEQLSKEIYQSKHTWSLPVDETVSRKITNDLNTLNFIDSGAKQIYIQPVIELFFATNTGFIWMKTHAKIRIKFILKNESGSEILNKTYESFYESSGLDSEYEGPLIDSEINPPNIVLGVCLRKTLDKFYEEIDNVL